MNRACFKNYTTELDSSKQLKMHEQNQHASSIRPIKNNFVRIKNSILILVMVMLTALSGKAGHPYTDNMLQAKHLADTATVEKTLVTAANYFGRIASMNSEKWLPHYYAAYCYTRISHLNFSDDVRDTWIDKAQAEADKAFALNPENAEVLIMKGFVLMARMKINPMIRGFKYNDETMSYFRKAVETDPENPRAYLWQGVNIFHTPEMFGGGKDGACPFIKKAIEKYEAFSPADTIAPDWGYGYAKEMQKNCQ